MMWYIVSFIVGFALGGALGIYIGPGLWAAYLYFTKGGIG